MTHLHEHERVRVIAQHQRQQWREHQRRAWWHEALRYAAWAVAGAVAGVGAWWILGG